MKTTLTAALIMSVLATPILAADNAANQQGRSQSAPDRESRAGGSGQTVEQKKAEIMQHIEERITNSQAEKVCVQSAQSHDELKSCREKYRPKKLPDGNQQRDQQQSPPGK